jgi:hypothetical protein
VYACKVAGADGWAGMRVGARRVHAGPNAPGRARRRALPEFGGLRAAGGFGSSARFGDACPRPLGESHVVRVGSHGRVGEPDGLKIRPGGCHSLWGESYPRSTGDEVEDGQAIVHPERTRRRFLGVGEDPVKRPPARSSRERPSEILFPLGRERHALPPLPAGSHDRAAGG